MRCKVCLKCFHRPLKNSKEVQVCGYCRRGTQYVNNKGRYQENLRCRFKKMGCPQCDSRVYEDYQKCPKCNVFLWSPEIISKWGLMEIVLV